MKAFAWVEPKDLTEAIAAGAAKGALFKAGGIDVADRLKEHLDQPDVVVNLRRLPELDFVREDAGALSIGPLVTLARLSEDPAVTQTAAALARAAGHAATPQVRAAATLGGNLAQRPRCWYFRSEHFPCHKKGGQTCFAIVGQHENHAIFDNDQCAAVHASGTATALVALGARVTLQGPKGRRELPIEEFFTPASGDVTRENVLNSGELIVEVRIPAGGPSSYVKLMQKQSFDWPMVDAAARLTVEGGIVKEARIAIGGVAHTPRRVPDVEAALVGKRLDAAGAEVAAKLAARGATPLPHNGHKVALLPVAVRRAVLAAGGVA
jgi:xanthine dehydrogenase YagS FAD-binding subunit